MPVAQTLSEGRIISRFRHFGNQRWLQILRGTVVPGRRAIRAAGVHPSL